MTEKKEKSSRWNWKKLLNYQSIVKQVPFLFYLAFLAVVYIYNGHMADKTVRKINTTAKEVKELQWEYKSLKSEVMFRSKPSELTKALQPLGLNELQASPYVLKDSLEEYMQTAHK
ncbi:MAG TPA: FtsL-like putative cell division protein [Niabella sp.]